jgi:hypothetical protein
VSFDYLRSLRKLKKKIEEWAGVMNEKPNQGVRERKRIHFLDSRKLIF